MYRLVCSNCKSNNDFSQITEKPVECAYCFSVFNEESVITELEINEKAQLKGIKLIFQQTGQEIIVESPYVLIGREHVGSDVLGKIIYKGNPVISRRHCSITLINNFYWLKDEESSNGTFLGIEKANCVQPQRIIDGCVLFLGREAFVARYIYSEEVNKVNQPKADSINNTNEQVSDNGDIVREKVYRCNQACGYESKEYAEICPKCLTIKSLVLVNK